MFKTETVRGHSAATKVRKIETFSDEQVPPWDITEGHGILGIDSEGDEITLKFSDLQTLMEIEEIEDIEIDVTMIAYTDEFCVTIACFLKKDA